MVPLTASAGPASEGPSGDDERNGCKKAGAGARRPGGTIIMIIIIIISYNTIVVATITM